MKVTVAATTTGFTEQTDMANLHRLHIAAARVSVSVEPELAGMEARFPAGFEFDDLSRLHVRRGALEDAEPQVSRHAGAAQHYRHV